jgi:hypothetical protein
MNRISTTALTAIVPLALLGLATSSSHAAGATPQNGGRECFGKAGDSLVVKGMSCAKAERLLPAVRETALAAWEEGRFTFKYKGFTCRLPHKDGYNIVCVDRKPKKRSFEYTAD